MTRRTLYIGNTVEAFAGPILRAPSSQRTRHLAFESALSQRSLYWGGDSKTIVTSQPIPDWVLTCAARAFGWSDVQTLSLQDNLLSICKSLLTDEAVRIDINTMLLAGKSITISPYCVTSEFLDLVRTLRGEGCSVFVPEEPVRDSEWVRDYLDSKVGFRIEAERLFHDEACASLPEGYVCSTVEEAAAISRWFHSRGSSCLIKANHGESGWGCFPMLVDEPKDVAAARMAMIRADATWSTEAFVVESFVTAQAHEGAFPSVEAYVHEGGVDVLYCCCQIIDESGFRGVIVDDRLIPIARIDQMRMAAQRMGAHFARLGYRGYFDIDFIVDERDKLFALEANARRSGGTHVHDISQALVRAGWRPGCLLSEDGLTYGAQCPPNFDFRAAILDLLFPMKNQCRGVFITQLSTDISACGYVAVGNDLADVRDLQRLLYKSLGVGSVSR